MPEEKQSGSVRTVTLFQWPSVLQPLAWWDCDFESHQGYGCLSIVSVMCCQVEVYCVGLITRPEKSYRVGFECDREASIVRRSQPTRGCCVFGGDNNREIIFFFLITPHVHTNFRGPPFLAVAEV